MLSTTESHLEEVFSAIARVERVKKIRDYAFVHFNEREGALKAIDMMNGNVFTYIYVCMYKCIHSATWLVCSMYLEDFYTYFWSVAMYTSLSP